MIIILLLGLNNFSKKRNNVKKYNSNKKIGLKKKMQKENNSKLKLKFNKCIKK